MDALRNGPTDAAAGGPNKLVGATISGRLVGTVLPPAGSSVTRMSLTPTRLPGTPTSAAPAAVTLNRAVVGAGLAPGRSSHTS